MQAVSAIAYWNSENSKIYIAFIEDLRIWLYKT